MKIYKKASGQPVIKLSRLDWLSIGKKAGWVKVSQNEQLVDKSEMMPSSPTMVENINTQKVNSDLDLGRKKKEINTDVLRGFFNQIGDKDSAKEVGKNLNDIGSQKIVQQLVGDLAVNPQNMDKFKSTISRISKEKPIVKSPHKEVQTLKDKQNIDQQKFMPGDAKKL